MPSKSVTTTPYELWHGRNRISQCRLFFEDEFPSIDEIEKDLELYELQQDLQPYLGEGEDLNSRQVTDDGEPV